MKSMKQITANLKKNKFTPSFVNIMCSVNNWLNNRLMYCFINHLSDHSNYSNIIIKTKLQASITL